MTCENGDFAADIEVARGVPRAPVLPEPLLAPAEVETPGVKTCEALAEFLSDRCRRDLEGDAGDRRRRNGRARADPRRRPHRAGQARRGARPPVAPVRPTTRSAQRSARAAARSARSGSRARSSPTRRCASGQFVAGANRDGWHLRGVEAGRDFEARFADLRESADGRYLPELRRPAARSTTAIEVGHIFKLGTRYSEPLGATLPRRGRAGAAR